MIRKIISFMMVVLVAASFTLSLGGCASHWSLPVLNEDGESLTIDSSSWKDHERFAVEDRIRLEHFLYSLGFRVIERIEIISPQGSGLTLPWKDAADHLWLTRRGDLLVEDQLIPAESITIRVSAWEDQIEAGLIDLAPTAASALGISPPEITTGKPLTDYQAESVLLVFLDGFGYLRYQEARTAGLIPVLNSLDPPLIGLTTYPPITTVSTASLLTGADPRKHGVETRGIRKTDHSTLLDAAADAGLQVAAVEGEALAFQLRGADFQLSGDRDGSGGTDDNVLENALAVLDEGAPDLLLVHFHGIDDLGHEFGPLTAPEEEKIREVDKAVGQILERLPSGTLALIFADHGMHAEEGQERLGNHGHLIERDMLIPIWVVVVQ